MDNSSHNDSRAVSRVCKILKANPECIRRPKGMLEIGGLVGKGPRRLAKQTLEVEAFHIGVPGRVILNRQK